METVTLNTLDFLILRVSTTTALKEIEEVLQERLFVLRNIVRNPNNFVTLSIEEDEVTNALALVADRLEASKQRGC